MCDPRFPCLPPFGIGNPPFPWTDCPRRAIAATNLRLPRIPTRSRILSKPSTCHFYSQSSSGLQCSQFFCSKSSCGQKRPHHFVQNRAMAWILLTYLFKIELWRGAFHILAQNQALTWNGPKFLPKSELLTFLS